VRPICVGSGPSGGDQVVAPRASKQASRDAGSESDNSGARAGRLLSGCPLARAPGSPQVAAAAASASASLPGALDGPAPVPPWHRARNDRLIAVRCPPAQQLHYNRIILCNSFSKAHAMHLETCPPSNVLSPAAAFQALFHERNSQTKHLNALSVLAIIPRQHMHSCQRRYQWEADRSAGEGARQAAAQERGARQAASRQHCCLCRSACWQVAPPRAQGISVQHEPAPWAHVTLTGGTLGVLCAARGR